jgi:hypothetical protein
MPEPKIEPSPHRKTNEQPPARIINEPPPAGQNVSLEQALANSKAAVEKAK